MGDLVSFGEKLCVGSCIYPCVCTRVCIREGLPAGSVVVGEGEEPPDGQLWQRGQLWSKAQEEEEGGESSRLSRREKRWSRAAEWGTWDDGVFKPMVSLNNQEQTPATFTLGLEYSRQSIVML